MMFCFCCVLCCLFDDVCSALFRKQLDKIEASWTDFHGVVQAILSAKKITKTQVGLVAANNLPLLKQMKKCVKFYEKDASQADLKAAPGLAVTINLSGKRCMLTQNMSKAFFNGRLWTLRGYNKLNLFEIYSIIERTLKGFHGWRCQLR